LYTLKSPYVTCFNSFLCPTELLMIVRIKTLYYSKISAILCSLISVFTLFYLSFGEHVNSWEKTVSSLLYLTLVTSCIIGPFFCCHLLYLIRGVGGGPYHSPYACPLRGEANINNLLTLVLLKCV